VIKNAGNNETTAFFSDPVNQSEALQDSGIALIYYSFVVKEL
jgi:hypothetical protein